MSAPGDRTVWGMRGLRRDPLRFLETLAASGDVVPFAVGSQRAVLLSQPADICGVLRSNDGSFVKAPALSRAKHFLGNGLLTAEGDFHRRRRQIAQPAFYRSFVERYVETMVRLGRRASDSWRTTPVFQVATEMRRLTLSVVTATLFSADLDEKQSEDVRSVVEWAIASRDPLLTLLAPLRRMRPARKQLLAVVENLIERRLRSDEPREDLLGLLLSAAGRDDERSRQQLQDDVLTMLLAGHDTIANALTWTWILLARHAEIERAFHTEVDRVLGGRPPAVEDVPQLKYTRAVFSEALRLFPPAWVVARLAVRDHALEAAVIPAGTLVVMSQYLVHRDPPFFVEPLTFNPERWLPGGSSEASNLAYFPFGGGPRSCIGEGFAWMEGVLLLAVVAQQWRVRPVPAGEFETETRITLRPKGLVPARLERRF